MFSLRLLPELLPHWNISPSQPLAVIRTPGELETVTFGFIPPFAPEPKLKWVNARAETVAKQSAFRRAFAERRCLVVVDGFYEWRALGKTKQPYMIRLASGEPFALAGIWERWTSRTTGEVIDSAAIITTEAEPVLAPIHPRQPIILAPADYAAWLAPKTPRPERLLVTQRTAELRVTAVTSIVSHPHNDGPECELPAS